MKPSLSQLGSWLERRNTLVILVLCAALSVAFTWPLLSHITYWGIQDWDFNYFKQASAARSMRQYGQYPLWNPWYFGGTPMLGDPESRIFYPTFPLYLAIDAVAALKIEVVIHYFIGLCGSFALARHHGLSRSGSITAAIVYMLSGMFALSLSSGMTMFVVGAYIPWVFLGYLRSLEDKEWVVVAAAALALMFLGGAVHCLAFTGLWLAVYGLAQVAFKPALWKRVASSGISIAVLATAFSAVKLLATLSFMAKYPRNAPMLGGFSVQAFAEGLLGRHPDVTASIIGQDPRGRAFWTGSCWGDDETGMYIGIIGLVLVVVGIVVRMRSKESRLASLPLLVSMFVAMWMSFGFRAPPLWSLVSKLPIFDSMRTPERLRFVFFLAVALFAAFAVDAARSWVGRRWGPHVGRALAVVIPTLLFVDYSIVNAPTLSLGAAIEPQAVQKRQTFQQIGGLPMYCAPGRWLDPATATVDIPRTCSWFSLYPTMLSNQGGLNSDAAIGLEYRPAARDANSSGYLGELFVAGAGRAYYLKWSPNRLVIRASLDGPGLVVVNQNHDDGWRTDTGQTESYDGLLAVSLPAGQHDVVLSYQPTGIALGFGVTAGSAIAAIIGFMLLRRRRRTA